MAHETVRVAVTANSKLWIDGTSNLHSWSCKAETFRVDIDLDKIALAELEADLSKVLERVEVTVRVTSLTCGHDAMDDTLYKTLNASASTEITCIMSTFEAVSVDTKGMLALKAIGTLAINGRVNNVAMVVATARLADGSVRATGTVPVKMTDFGIAPPRAMFGALRTGDEVKVNFEITVAGESIAAALGGDK